MPPDITLEAKVKNKYFILDDLCRTDRMKTTKSYEKLDKDKDKVKDKDKDKVKAR